MRLFSQKPNLVINRDQVVTIFGLVILVALGWAYMIHIARAMDDHMSMAMPQMMAWSWFDWWSMFLMWTVMMIAMMVPSATPTILIYAKVNQNRRQKSLDYVSTGVFLFGYLLAWTTFSMVATTGNWLIHTQGLLTGMMGSSTSNILGAALLIAAGIYQWTPFKYACLNHCRTPLGFIMTEWKEGKLGAITMGVKHGFYCVACCWLLMGLLFVLGVMNLLWIGLLAGFVLLEKLLPQGIWVSRISGLGFVAWGVILILVNYI